VPLVPVLVLELEQVLEPEQEQALAREQELVPEQALEPEQAQVPERVLEPRRQPGSQLAIMPAELTKFSFSSRNPPLRFWSA